MVDAGPFDLILCTEVLEHVFDWPAAFRAIVKLLRPGGVCVLTSPFFWKLHEEPYDFWRATPHSIRRMAKSVGLEVEKYEAGGTTFGAALSVLGFAELQPRAELRWLARPAALLARVLRRGLQHLLNSGIFEWLATPSREIYPANLVLLRAPLAGG